MGQRSLKPSWGMLWLLVPGFALLWAAFAEDRAEWRELSRGEATPLMQAESLLHDGDLSYDRLDFDRHLVTRYGAPPDLALASGTGGRVLTYDASFLPATLFAGGLGLFGELGFIPINALVLLLAAALAWLFLRPALGSRAAPWLALLVFGSFAFATTFRATPETMVFSATLIAAALARSASVGGVSADKHGLRLWLLAGALLSMAIFTRWQNAVLLLPFLAAAWAGPEPAGAGAKKDQDGSGGSDSQESSRGPANGNTPKVSQAVFALVIGLLAGLGVQSLVLWSAGGGLGALDTVRFTFTPASGFPFIDVPTENWAHTVERLSALHFIGAPRFAWGLEPSLLARHGLYLLAGRHIGLLVYALAPLLLLAFGVRRRVALAWGLAFLLLVVLTLLLEPFDLAAGGGVGNSHFLPWLAASVLVWHPRLEASTAHWVAAAATLVAAPFLYALWAAPGAPPISSGPQGLQPNHAGVAAQTLLPFELSQQTFPGRDLDHAGLRIRLLSAAVREKRLDVLTLDGAEPAHLWVASPEPLVSLVLHFDESAPATIELLDDRGEWLDRMLRADGGVSFRIRVPARRHLMWWSPRPQWVYRVDFQLPNAGAQRLEWSLGGEV